MVTLKSSPTTSTTNAATPNATRTARGQELRRIQLRSRRLVTGGLLGQYRSAFRGTGLVYSDIREYQPGDDVKHIHWKATARTGTVYVKSYEEDRQLRVLLAVDVSASLRAPFGEQGHAKVVEFCSLVSTLTQRGNDLLGLCRFADTVVQMLPPKSGIARHHQILTALNREVSPHRVTDVRGMLKHLQSAMRRPSIIFVISDFYCPPFDQELKILAARHDVVLVQISHTESALPNVGLTSFVDPETGDISIVDTSSARVRARWQSLIHSREDALKKIAKECNVETIRILNDPLAPLASLMRKRGAAAHAQR